MRTKYFDDYFLHCHGRRSATSGDPAAGLDARAYRLPWPAGGSRDRPTTGDRLKTTTLAGIGAAYRHSAHGVIDSARDRPGAHQSSPAWTRRHRQHGWPGRHADLPAAGSQDRLFDNSNHSVLRVAMTLPNLSRALWISTQAGYEMADLGFASTAWTSTWRRWCIRRTQPRRRLPARQGWTLRAQCGPTYSGAMVCPFRPHTTTIRSAKSSSSAVV